MRDQESEPVPLSRIPAEQLDRAHQIVQERGIPFSWAVMYVTGKVLTASPEEAREAIEKICMD